MLRWAPLLLLIGVGWAAIDLVPWFDLTLWAGRQQQYFQTEMARALRAVRAGEPAALLALCSATAAYGVVHAIGPGHGKLLIGGAALESNATFRRLAGLTLLSSLAQAGTAILLVGVLVFGLRTGARDAADLTETWLAPLSVHPRPRPHWSRPRVDAWRAFSLSSVRKPGRRSLSASRRSCTFLEAG